MMILNSVKRLQMKKQLVYILFLIGAIGFAQENPVSIKTDTTTIKIGEQIQFKIAVQEKENVVFPKLKLDSLNKIEVVESLPIDTASMPEAKASSPTAIEPSADAAASSPIATD